MTNRRSILAVLAAVASAPAAAQIRLRAEMHMLDRRAGRSGGDPQGAPLWLMLAAGEGPLGSAFIATRREPRRQADPDRAFLVARLDGGGSYEVDTRALADVTGRMSRETTFVLLVAVEAAAFQELGALIAQVHRRGRAAADQATVMHWFGTAARLAGLAAPPDAAHPAGFVRALRRLNS